jgi:hypothetical protein
MNSGADASMIDAEVPFHEWIRTIDRRTRGYDPKRKSRFDHYNASQTVPLADPFVVSGQRLRFPGDTSLGASAGNVCNCRCSAAAAFDGPKAPKAPKPPPPPKIKPPKSVTEPKPVAAPQPKPAPAPNAPAIDKSKPIEERIKIAGEREDVKTIRENLVKIKRDYEAEFERLMEAYQKAKKELFEVELEQIRLDARRELKQITKKEHARLAAELDARRKVAYETKIADTENRGKVRAKFRADSHAALGESRPNQFDISVPTGDRTFLGSDGKIVTGTSGSRAFSEKFEEAVDFIGRLVNMESRTAQAAEPYMLPRGTRAFCYGDKYPCLTEVHDVGTFVHELGHVLEEHPGIKQAVNEFLEMRFKRAGTSTVRLQDVLPNNGYLSHEFGNPDHFGAVFGDDSAYYVGKRYADGGAELISMGIQQLFDDPGKMATVDPELFNFLIGILRDVL